MQKPFQIMAKPSGADCNLACRYCYYIGKRRLYSSGSAFKMSDAVLEEFTRQYIASQPAQEIVFAWQGGEPTLMGIDFFQKALKFQKAFAPPGRIISNTFQTNGTLLNEEWCLFLKENHFLVGLSLDGPADIHDTSRVTPSGKGTFDRVYHSLQLLKKYNVEFNILCVVSSASAGKGRETYRFMKNEGITYIQFIPLVLPSKTLMTYSAGPLEWGQFLCDVFDEWAYRDLGKVFVMNFESVLASWLGFEPSICANRKSCGWTMVLEHTGDLYACDFYVDGSHRIGNIMDTDLRLLSRSPVQSEFGQKKRRLSETCLSCPAKKACNGGCPAQRTAGKKDGISQYYLCRGFQHFYQHSSAWMIKVSGMLKNHIPIDKIAGQLSLENRKKIA